MLIAPHYWPNYWSKEGARVNQVKVCGYVHVVGRV